MAANAGLHSALQRLERAVAKLAPAEAVALIDAEIAGLENPEYPPHFEVQKAAVLYGAGKLTEALQLLAGVAEKYETVDSVHFFAGQYSLELGLYQQAIGHLTNCLDICESSNDGWYQDSAYMLRAYCAAKTGDAKLARHDLDHATEGDSMSWIPVDPVISSDSIEMMLR